MAGTGANYVPSTPVTAGDPPPVIRTSAPRNLHEFLHLLHTHMHTVSLSTTTTSYISSLQSFSGTRSVSIRIIRIGRR